MEIIANDNVGNIICFMSSQRSQVLYYNITDKSTQCVHCMTILHNAVYKKPNSFLRHHEGVDPVPGDGKKQKI